MARLPLLAALGLVVAGLTAAEDAPVLAAEATAHPRTALFAPDEEVRIAWSARGPLAADEVLEWSVRDHLGAVLASGESAVGGAGGQAAGTIAPGDLGPGAFALRLALRRAGRELPAAGTRPAGSFAYGVLPVLAPLAPATPDAARFGIQGTAFTTSGVHLQGDPFALYPQVGNRWVYLSRRLGDLAPKALDDFKPVLDPEQHRRNGSHLAAHDLLPLIDLCGVPPWLRSTGAPAGGRNETGQYPPGDWTAFATLVGRIAAEQAARRRGLFPAMRRNWYQLHWEPDWHWKGSDEEFIRMYEVARAAIRANDPDGLLLGPNYGVLATGNDHLDRLLPKGLARHLDGLLTHTYHVPMNVSPEQGGLVGQVQRLVALGRTHLGAQAPIHNTEWGTNWFGRRPAQDPAVLRQELAWFLRGHLITLGEGVDATWLFYLGDHDTNGWGLFYNLDYPTPAFGPVRVAPKPIFAGTAFMTRLLEGTRSLGRLDHLGEGALGYAFQRGDRLLWALWSRDGARHAVRLPGDAATVRYDAVGRPQPLPRREGVLALELDDLPTYLLGVAPAAQPGWGGGPATLAATIAGEVLPGEGTLLLRRGAEERRLGPDRRLPADLAAGTWLAERHQDGRIVATRTLPVLAAVAAEALAPAPVQLARLRLANRTTGVQPVTLELLADGRPIQRQALTLAASAGTEAVFLRDTGPAPAGAALGARLTTAGGAVALLPLPSALATLHARRAQPAPAIDGAAGEWPLELFTVSDRAERIEIAPGRWRGPADLSLRAAVQLDDRHLYLAVVARDQDHHQSKPAADAWREDALQIGLAVESADGRRTAQKLLLALSGIGGEVLAWRHEAPTGLAGGDVRKRLVAAVRRSGDETTYELAIPWAEVAPGLDGAPEPGRLRLGLYLDDVDRQPDGGAGERIALDPFGGMGWFRAQDFAVVVW
ncbi:MAG: hypothetical protein L6R48_18890 [Planctomycetes bacterium]|nr:hypothetical protein [Planctomycetota bacterium]